MSDPPTKAVPSFLDFTPYDTPVDHPLDDPLSGRALIDKMGAQGHRAARLLTGGKVDDYYPKILSYLPDFSDDTGIPREYAGGSAEEQYKSQWKADDADLKKRYPDNYYKGGGAIASAPAAIGGVAGGIPAAVAGFGTGALRGAADSANTGWEKFKDMMREGSVEGAFATGANLVQEAAPLALAKLRGGGPPTGPTLAPAGAFASREAPAAASAVERPQINMSKAVRPGKYDAIQDLPLPTDDDVAAFGEWDGPASSEPVIPEQIDPNISLGELKKLHPPPDTPSQLAHWEDQMEASGYKNIRHPAQTARPPKLELPERGTDTATPHWPQIEAGLPDKPQLTLPDDWELPPRQPPQGQPSNPAWNDFELPPQPMSRPTSRQLLAQKTEWEKQTEAWRALRNKQLGVAARGGPDKFNELTAEGYQPVAEPGHARSVVRQPGDPSVYKTALNRPSGPRQNYDEYRAWQNMDPELTDFFAGVEGHDPAFSWLKSKAVTPFHRDGEALAQHLGLDMGDEYWFKNFLKNGAENPTPNAQEFLRRYRLIEKKMPQIVADLGKPEQWGLDSKGMPVVLDYGYRTK